MAKKSNNEIKEHQGKELIDAKIKNSIAHFIYTSLDRHGKRSDTDPTAVPHFANKYRNTVVSLAADEETFKEASKICKEKVGFDLPATPRIVAQAV